MTMNVLIVNTDRRTVKCDELLILRGTQEIHRLRAGEFQEVTLWDGGGEITLKEVPAKKDV